MIGFILYETVDMLWHSVKGVYNITTGTYYWYYDIYNKSEEQKKIEDLEKIGKKKDLEIQKLEERLNKISIINVK